MPNAGEFLVSSGDNGCQGFSAADAKLLLDVSDGAQGPRGYQGVNGLQGVDGHQGTKGPQGFNGTQGSTGTRGYQGVDGHQGLNGPTGSGVQGVDGQRGYQGVDGHQGVKGPQGAPNGPQGFTGATGSTGSTGATGVQGRSGVQGFTGATGVGNQGLTGPTGVQGKQGFQGVIGGSGVQGFQGPSMVFPALIHNGEYVTIDNNSFINFTNNAECLLDVNSTFTCGGGFGLGSTSPTIASTPQNDYNMNGSTPFNGVSMHQINNTSGAPLNITGVVEGFADQIKWIMNKSASGDPIILKHNDSGSSARNRFLCAGELDVVLYKYEWAMLCYNNNDGRWYAAKTGATS